MEALRGVTVAADDGELLAVVGPSGSGKSTLLRCIAGLETPDSGTIQVGGREVTALAPAERDVALVFQDLALFPHLTVEENVAFPLRARKMKDDDLEAAVAEALRITGLSEMRDRRPDQLSGGERQRVALARAIVRKPALFLLDEPLSSLDPEARARSRVDLRSLQQSLGTTAIYVTHDQTEAMTMADRLVVLRAGAVEQVGTPETVYDAPATGFVARFIGSPPMNLLDGRKLGVDGVAGVRPEHARIARDGRIEGVVRARELLGAHLVYHLDVDGERFAVRSERSEAHEIGDRVRVGFDDSQVHRFTSRDGPRA